MSERDDEPSARAQGEPKASPETSVDSPEPKGDGGGVPVAQRDVGPRELIDDPSARAQGEPKASPEASGAVSPTTKGKAVGPHELIDDLREQLRSLGYLSSRWERFFLADLGERVGFLSANLKGSLKLGLSGGMLVSILLVLGTLQEAPDLAREPSDLLVLGLYFTLASVISIAALEFLAGLFFHALYRAGVAPRLRVEFLARGFGILLGLASLTYLTLWWRAHRGGSWVALGLCLLASLALGRFAHLALLGVLARMNPKSRLKGPRLSRRTMLPLALTGGLLYVSALVLLTRQPAPAEVPASPYRSVPSHHRIVLLAVDGLTLDAIELMRSRGEAPGFDALARKGATFPLVSLPDRVPSLIWTSIATGQAPSGHGIRAMATERIPGLRTPLQLGEDRSLGSALASMGQVIRLTEPRPLSKALSHVKAVWDVLSDQGRSVGIAGWWATWPAGTVNGFLLSDRLFFKLREGGTFDREVDSIELFRRLETGFAADRAEAERALGALRREAGPELQLAFARDSYHVVVADRLRREQEPELYMVYLSSLDVAAMKLLSEPPRDFARLSGSVRVVESGARFLDGVLLRTLSTLGPKDVLVVVAEPGRLHAASVRGALFLCGEPIRPQPTGREVSAYDVAPTLLYLLGFPASEDMPGAVVTEAFLPQFLDGRRPERIATFGSRRLEREGILPTEFDREMIQQLRSLGYVQ